MQLNDTTTTIKGQHLSLAERIEIQTLHIQGHSNRSIARILDRSHSTINVEMKRGIVDQVKKVNGKKIFSRNYYATTGHEIYQKHRLASQPSYKLVRVQQFLAFAHDKIKNEKWSPDAVIGYALKNELFHKDDAICTKTLYRYIDENLLDIKNIHLQLKLRRNTKKMQVRKRKRILGESIEQRPSIINDRLEFGHWEIDYRYRHRQENKGRTSTSNHHRTTIPLPNHPEDHW